MDAQGFWPKIDKRGEDECWPWTGAKDTGGYGHLRFDGGRHQAHRVSFYLTNGYWPNVARHSCDNRPCCNPAHLLDGTRIDNVRDMMERGRQAKGEEHGNSKLTESDVLNILADKRTNIAIARHYGIHPDYVSDIKLKKYWRHVEELPATTVIENDLFAP